MAPQIIFGTATFGMDLTDFQGPETVKTLLATLKTLGITRLDTAARYPPLNPGRSEQLVGEGEAIAAGFLVDTKVYTDTKANGSGDLTQDAIERSVSASLDRIQAPGGWGVSNFPPPLLEKILALCDENGWAKPSWYQGVYNAVTRGPETQLLPLLRAHERTLSGGFLTGKLVNNKHADTRAGDNNPLGKMIQRAFGAEDLQAAMKRFDEAVGAEGLTSTEVAIRWVMHHSALTEDDSVILGASKIAQIQETVAFIRKGELPAKLLRLTEDLWETLSESRGKIC
ncbi:hypothetical protein N0V93_005976 [Gnomoniopsis smithogilvyi]|uniref:NADP-dependent oxidoreductase domain-containing protein n=1 Tax=Gnomoniopsis smithogilvyi TaxID=1191159 RepID=A0A9W8YWK9_9PEZI|nr:hypothetical protein N0V93_005976 [Gnomoniopsis smithogilvyi]